MIFLDIEASSLNSGSYPIEVAWCRHDLTSAWSTIIRPAEDWGERDWSSESERVHGISRAHALAEGLPVTEVADRLNRDLAGHRPLTDNPEMDGRWLWRLYAEVGRQPAFDVVRPKLPSQIAHSEDEKDQIAALDADIVITAAADDAGFLADEVVGLADGMRAETLIVPHRALDDVVGLALDLAAISVLALGRDHGHAAAASFRGAVIDRARGIMRRFGRR